MSRDIRDDIFINYYIKKRIMRKTHDTDLLGKIYASKYANWFVPFLKEHGIAESPLLLSCNTLYQLPDFFTIRNRSFFVADYYLHSYFYDFNYALSDIDRNEFGVNLHIKTFIEQAYLKGNIDLSFALCQTSPNLETYKESDDYRDKTLTTFLVEKTDLQETLTFLHEASHFIFSNNECICSSEDYQEVVEIFNKMIPNVTAAFLEECYCDYSSISYILEKTYQDTLLSHREYFLTLFLALIYTYALQLTMACQHINISDYSAFMNQEMDMLWLRFGGMQTYIYKFLIKNNCSQDVSDLNDAYQNGIETFKKIGNKVRQILKFTKDAGEQHLEMFKGICNEQKKQYIQDFLQLVS